jgi:RES domain-containing protein
LNAHPDWLKPWSGVFFRFQTVDFPSIKNIISGEGARQRGGRWNQPGTPALYGSTECELDACKNAGFITGIIMGTAGKAKEIQRSALTAFRFSHRGVRDYPSLLVHYRDAFHLPQPALVRLTGFSPRSIAKWSQGELPSAKQEKALVEMDRLLGGVARVMEPARVGRWLRQPNAAFDGSTPLQVIERGELDRIWRMLYDIESGQPG